MEEVKTLKVLKLRTKFIVCGFKELKIIFSFKLSKESSILRQALLKARQLRAEYIGKLARTQYNAQPWFAGSEAGSGIGLVQHR
jgi:hypothetical protein